MPSLQDALIIIEDYVYLVSEQRTKQCWMARAVCAPYFCMEIPIEHYLINSIPNCLRHHVGPPLSQRRSDIRVPFGVPSGRVCIILYGYNGARDEKTKWRRRKFPSGISPE